MCQIYSQNQTKKRNHIKPKKKKAWKTQKLHMSLWISTTKKSEKQNIFKIVPPLKRLIWKFCKSPEPNDYNQSSYGRKSIIMQSLLASVFRFFLPIIIKTTMKIEKRPPSCRKYTTLENRSRVSGGKSIYRRKQIHN